MAERSSGDDPGTTADQHPNLSAELVAVLDRLPECLADTRAQHSLMAVAARLPNVFTAGPLGLEIRLAGPCAIDLFAAAIPGTPCFHALIASLRSVEARLGWADPAYARELAAVLDRWQRGEGVLPRIARYLLVEADSPDHPDGVPAVPNIFLAPHGARDFFRPGQPPNVFHRHREATVMAAAELSGTWPHPETVRDLSRIVEAITGEGEIFAVGTMTGRRAGSALRIAIRRLDDNGIYAVLRAAGRLRQADLFAEWTRTVRAPQRDLHFEIGPGTEPRVGMEFRPRHNWKQALADGWPELLEDLVTRGVADADRAAVVAGLIRPDGEPLWGLAHVKVAADESGILPVSKLYVGLLYRNRSGQSSNHDQKTEPNFAMA